jgi:integrase
LQWQARIRRKGYPDQNRTFETKTDAEAWARSVENEMDRGVFVSRAEAESTTLREALDRYITEYIPRLAQPYKETKRAQGLQRRALAVRFLASIRAKDIADFIKEREAEGMSGNTIRLDINMISRLYNVAATSWGMESLVNPVTRVPKPKVNKGRERRLEDGEEARLLKAAWPPFRPVILFALETAMRREEIASLTWDRVDLKNRAVRLLETKNGDARSVPLSSAALSILRTMPGKHEGVVFGLRDYTITKYMVKACKDAEISGLTFHDLRHEATSRFFEATDLDAMEIKTITGHRSMQMLARYSHLRTHRLADRLAGSRRGA